MGVVGSTTTAEHGECQGLYSGNQHYLGGREEGEGDILLGVVFLGAGGKYESFSFVRNGKSDVRQEWVGGFIFQQKSLICIFSIIEPLKRNVLRKQKTGGPLLKWPCHFDGTERRR